MTEIRLLTNVLAATMAGEGYGLVRDAAIAIQEGRIAWVGCASQVPAAFAGAVREDMGGRLVTPALIDCHTHIVHGGNRAKEFEMRLEGASYEEIARSGGGIVSTVAATREASEEALLAVALTRADALIAEGVGVVEIKSGYGLSLEDELKMLRVARAVEKARPLRVMTSFLGAHAVPKGMGADAYIDEVCIPALEAAHADGLVDAVDGFVKALRLTRRRLRGFSTRQRRLGCR